MGDRLIRPYIYSLCYVALLRRHVEQVCENKVRPLRFILSGYLELYIASYIIAYESGI
jgi:hypothetical protein